MASPANPPLPPELVQQMSSPEQAQSVFSVQGLNQPQPGMDVVQQVMGKIQELDQWASQVKQLIQALDPSLEVLLKPIAEAAMKLGEEVQQKAQRSGMARGSSVVPPQPPQNPSAGPASPAMQ